MATAVNFECRSCTYEEEMLIDLDKYVAWQHQGMYIQDAFPDFTAGQRELIKTGTCNACWEAMFSFEEDEDEES